MEGALIKGLTKLLLEEVSKKAKSRLLSLPVKNSLAKL